MKRSLTLLGSVLIAACGSNTQTAGTTTAPSTMVRTSGTPTTAECAHGGSMIDYGIDSNDNGVLDDSEVNGSVPVCNGNPGAAGPAGTAGAAGKTGPVGAVAGVSVVDSTGAIMPIGALYGYAGYSMYLVDDDGNVWNITNSAVSTLGLPFTGGPGVTNLTWYTSTDCSGDAYWGGSLFYGSTASAPPPNAGLTFEMVTQADPNGNTIPLGLTGATVAGSTAKSVYGYYYASSPYVTQCGSPSDPNFTFNFGGTPLPPTVPNVIFATHELTFPELPGTPPYSLSNNH